MNAAPSIAVIDCAADDEPRLDALRQAATTRLAFGPPSPAEIVERASGAEVLVTLYTYTPVNAAVIGALPGLRLIATRTSGFSHIDVAAAAEHSVAVATVPEAPAIAIAEYTFGAVIALGRGLFEARESTRAGRWPFTEFCGLELAGKTLGVLGLGSIGSRVAGVGAAFGMNVIAWSRREKDLPGVEHTSIEDVLARADIVSVNLALTPETAGLLDGKRLDLLKPDAVLVNTARGGILDEDELCRRLRDGRLGGACLDVLAAEPPGEERLAELATVPNLLVTPHISWHTPQTLDRQFGGMIENVLAFLDGVPQNLVTPTEVG